MDWIQVNWFFLNLIELIWVKLMNERSNNEIMKKWKNKKMKEWKNERKNEWTNERTNEWMNEWLTDWVCEHIYEYLHYMKWNGMEWEWNWEQERNEMTWLSE